MSEHADTADITFEALPDEPAATPLVPDSPVAMAESAAVFAPVLPPSPDVAVVPQSPWGHGGGWVRKSSPACRRCCHAAVYATLIVTFGFQVARVDGLSMAPTLEDHDRLIVNKLVYEIGEPRPGDIVMLYYPLNPRRCS
jgi:hypothetical protein